MEIKIREYDTNWSWLTSSLKQKIAKEKLIIGLMYIKIPTVDESIPFNAYKFRKSGTMVKNTTMQNRQI